MKNHTLKRLFGYLKFHRLRLFFVLLFAAVSTVFTVMAPFVIGKVTTTLFDSIKDGVFYWENIVWLLSALIFLYLTSQFFSFLQGFHMAKITSNVIHEIRSDIDKKCTISQTRRLTYHVFSCKLKGAEVDDRRNRLEPDSGNQPDSQRRTPKEKCRLLEAGH